MKFSGKVICAGPFLLLYTASAFAQFEVNPDHFNNAASQTPAKTSVVFHRNKVRQQTGVQAASKHAQPRSSKAQEAKLRFAKSAQMTHAERNKHAPRKCSRAAKATREARKRGSTVQVAQVPPN